MGIQGTLEVITGSRFTTFSGSFRRRWLIADPTSNELHSLLRKRMRHWIVRRTQAMLLFRLELSNQVKTVMCEDIMVLLYKQMDHCTSPRMLYTRIMNHVHERICSVPLQLLRRYYICIDKLDIPLPLKKDRPVATEIYPSCSRVVESGVMMPSGIAPLNVPRILKNHAMSIQMMQLLILYQSKDSRYHDIPIGWCHAGGTFHVHRGQIVECPSESWNIREGDLMSRLLLNYAHTDACVSWTLDSDQLAILLPVAPYFKYGLFWGTEYADENARARHKQDFVFGLRQDQLMKTTFCKTSPTILDWLFNLDKSLEIHNPEDGDSDVNDRVKEEGKKEENNNEKCCPSVFVPTLYSSNDNKKQFKPPLMFNMRHFYRTLIQDGMSPEGFVTFTMMNGWDYQKHTVLFPYVNAIDVYNAVKDVVTAGNGNPYRFERDFVAIVENAWSRHKSLDRIHTHSELRSLRLSIPSMEVIQQAYQLFRIGYPYWRTFHQSCPEMCRDDLFLCETTTKAAIHHRRDQWINGSIPFSLNLTSVVSVNQPAATASKRKREEDDEDEEKQKKKEPQKSVENIWKRRKTEEEHLLQQQK